MLVDSVSTFLSQRGNPELATFSVELIDGGVRVFREGHGSVHVPARPSGRIVDATIWRSTLRAQQVSVEVDRWFLDALGQHCSLLAMTDISDRPVNPDFSRHGDQVSFADGYPLLLVNRASLDDLNQRLESAVPMNRFRPNVVVQGPPAWAEDSWANIQIGEAVFRVAKPCGRCLVTTTDQETGERGVEPLRTLAMFRQVDQSVNFGMNLIPDKLAEIRVGDPVSVTNRSQAAS